MLKISYLYLSVFLGVMAITISCTDSQPTFNIENPSTYDFYRGGNSTVSFTGQTQRIAMATEFADNLSNFNTTETQLQELFSNMTADGGDANPYENTDLNASTKSVKSKIAASNDFFSANTAESALIKAQFDTWITAQTTEVFPAYNQLASPGVAGQIADGSSTRYISAKGLEYNQAILKSLIGALMVDQICNNYLSTSVLDANTNIEENDNTTLVDGKSYTNMEHKWDEAYGYLFGATSDKTDPLLTLGDDAFLNKYLGSVNDDADFSNYAENIWQAFKLGRAAIVAGDYDTRDEQAAIIRKLVSDVIGIRAVYYLQQGKNALENGDMGGAFHDFSEGVGFVYSLRFTRKSDSNDSYFSRSEVDAFINTLMSGNGFWDVTPAKLDEISEAIVDKFDFTLEQAAE